MQTGTLVSVGTWLILETGMCPSLVNEDTAVDRRQLLLFLLESEAVIGPTGRSHHRRAGVELDRAHWTRFC
jgi:hypothetical protein